MHTVSHSLAQWSHMHLKPQLPLECLTLVPPPFFNQHYHDNTHHLCYCKLIFHATSCTQLSLCNSQCLANSFLPQSHHSIYPLHAHCIPFSGPIISHASTTSTASENLTFHFYRGSHLPCNQHHLQRGGWYNTWICESQASTSPKSTRLLQAVLECLCLMVWNWMWL